MADQRWAGRRKTQTRARSGHESAKICGERWTLPRLEPPGPSVDRARNAFALQSAWVGHAFPLSHLEIIWKDVDRIGTWPAFRHRHGSCLPRRGHGPLASFAMTTIDPITEILDQVQVVDFAARAELFAASQEELRTLARRHMAGQRERHTWQTTALLNEAYLRMCSGHGRMRSGHGRDVVDLEHFMNLSSRIMRQILVDHARLRNAVKRGGSSRRVALDSIVDEYEKRSKDELVEVSAGLDELAKQDPDTVRFVQLHFFGGLNQHEAAAVLGWSERTARRRWSAAKLFLLRRLER